jgi:hypothetical protein
MKEHPWHRRHAIHIVAALPEETEDALIVLRLATQIVTDFLAQLEPTKKAAPVVVLVGGA